jgi:hypothetical protein
MIRATAMQVAVLVWCALVLLAFAVLGLGDAIFHSETREERRARMAKYPDPYGNRARGSLGQIETCIKFMLVLALIATSAHATGRTGVLVIRHPIDAAAVTTTPQNFQTACQITEGHLLQRGAVDAVVPASACVTADVSNNRFIMDGVTTQAAITVHENWAMSVTHGLYPAAFAPWTFLSGTTWPTGPQIWFITPVNGCGIDAPAAGDSMGVADCYTPPTPSGTYYDTSNPGRRWKNLYATGKSAVRCNASNGVSGCTTPVGGILRCVVGYKASKNNDGSNGKDIDSLRVLTGSTEDSMAVWTWERFAGDPARQIFCIAGAGGIFDDGCVLYAYALGESTCVQNGDTMFPDRDAMTQEYGVGASRANGLGHPDGVNLYYGGSYCPKADSCDISNERAGCDTLARHGVNFTAFVDPESLSTGTNATMIAMLKGYQNVSFALQPVSGTYTDASSAAASTTRIGGAGRCIDPIGISRRRTLFPYALGASARFDTLSCVADSGSVACNLINGWKALVAAVGVDRIDWTLLPAAFDWTPQEWTSAAAGTVQLAGSNPNKTVTLLGGQDSLVAAFVAADIKTVLFSPTIIGGNVGVGWSAEGGALTGKSAPAGWQANESQLRFKWGGVTYEGVSLIGTRWEPSSATYKWYASSHAGIGNEWEAGAVTGKFYLIDAGSYYKHSFYTSTRGFVVPFSMFGGPLPNPWPQFPGIRQIVWLTDAWKGADAHLPTRADGTRGSFAKWVRFDMLKPGMR